MNTESKVFSWAMLNFWVVVVVGVKDDRSVKLEFPCNGILLFDVQTIGK